MVGVYEVEGAGGRAAEEAAELVLAPGAAVGASRLRAGRMGRSGRRGGGGQAVQALGRGVGVELDLCVVEVLLSIAALRITVPPKGGADTQGKSTAFKIFSHSLLS